MGELTDVKDSGPNKNLVDRLERLLKEAKAGDILSMAYVVATKNQDCSNGWVIDPRSSWRKVLAEVVLMQQDIATDILLLDSKSVTCRAFRDGIFE